MLKDQGVTIFNRFEVKQNYNIDYNYYIRETQKVIDIIEPKQLMLF